MLRAGGLIRIRRLRNYDEIEAYHTRIREEVVAVIPQAIRRKHHSSLALALDRYSVDMATRQATRS